MGKRGSSKKGGKSHPISALVVIDSQLEGETSLLSRTYHIVDPSKKKSNEGGGRALTQTPERGEMDREWMKKMIKAGRAFKKKVLIGSQRS